jgi:hypothetical protein
MGSVVWSADTIILSFLQPAVYAYNSGRYSEAAVNLDSLNNFFLGFGVGISDLPVPKLENRDLGHELSSSTYSKRWYEMYFPLISKSMGKYLRETIDNIKIERGVM